MPESPHDTSRDGPQTPPSSSPRAAEGARTSTEPGAAAADTGGSRLGRWWLARRRWQRRTMVAIPIVVLLYTLGGFFGVPLVLRHLVVPQIGKGMTGSIALRDAQCNPYTFLIGLDGLEIRDAQGRTALAFERLETDFELWRSLFRPGLHFQHLLLDRPVVGVHVSADGTLNLANLFKPDPEPREERPLERIPHLVVDAFDLREGTVSIDDLSLPEPFNTVIGGITIDLEKIDTAPDYTNTSNLVATTETGARLEWKGTFELDPFSSKGTIVASQLYMPRFMPYAMRLLDARVTEGRLDFTLDYDFEPVHEPRLALLRFPSIVAHELQVRHLDQSLLSLPLLQLEKFSVNATTRTLEGAAIRLHDGTLLATRDADGQLNFASIVAAAKEAHEAQQADAIGAGEGADGAGGAGASGATGAVGTAVSAADRGARVDPADIQFPIQQLLTALSYLFEDAVGPWSVDITELAVENQTIDVVDERVSPAVRVPLRRSNLRAGPIRSADDFLVPFTASTTVFDAGQVEVGGSMGILQRTLDATLRADQLELVSAAPYLALVLSPPLDVPTLRSGQAFLDLRLTARATDPEATSLELAGPLRLELAEVVRAEDGIPLVSAQTTTFDGTTLLTTRPGGGVGGSWSGAFTTSGVNGGEPLMRALGLGDGGVTMHAVAVHGRAEASREGDGRGRLTWEGSVTIDGMDGDGVALSGPTDIEAGQITLAGKAEAIAEAPAGSAGATIVRWNGKVQSRESHVFSRTTNVDARLGDFVVEGSVAATMAPDAEQRIEWTGSVVATEARAALAEATKAALRAFETQGSLVTTLRPQEILVDWRGTVATQDATIEGPDWSTAAGSMSLDGAAKVNHGGPEAIAWNGVVDLGAVAVRTDLAGGAEARGERLRLEGALTSPADTLDRLLWKGMVELTKPAAKGTVSGGPATLEAATLRVDGTTSLDRTDRGTLEHTGVMDISEAKVQAAQVASGLDGTLRTVRIDGTLLADPLLEGPNLRWTGALATTDTGIDAGAGDLDLTLASFEAQGALGVEAGTTGGVTWDGTLTLGSTSGTAAGSKLELGGAEVAGALSAGIAESAPIEWKGRVSATDARTAVPDGTSTISAARIGHEGTARLVRGATPDVAATGDLNVEQVGGKLGPASLEVPSVRVEGIDLRHAAGELAVASLAVQAPAIRTEVTITPAEPARASDTAPAATTPPSARLSPAARGEALAAALPYRVALGSFTLTDGRIEMVDVTAQPPSTTAVDQISIAASNVDTDGSAMSELAASARLQGTGRMEAAGKANIFENPPSGNLKVTLNHVPMPPYSPLSGRFAGFLIDAGRLDVTLPIDVDAGKVKGQLDFLMDQLELGQKVKSPDAPNIPLDLGLALLRDPNDQIRGSVPFSGDMSSPEFSFGGLIWQAVLSLMGKIVTAPFQLIAGAFAGGQEIDLSFVAFAPGSAELNGEALKKLDVLAKGLTERPQIGLQASGRIARDADIAAIRPNLLRDEARRRLQSSFPDIKDVPPDVYRQIVISKHAELPPDRQAPRLPNGDAPPFEQVERIVLATMEVTDEMLRDLAKRRADAIRAMLTGEKGIAPDRVTATVPEGPEIEAADPRAELSIEGEPLPGAK